MTTETTTQWKIKPFQLDVTNEIVDLLNQVSLAQYGEPDISYEEFLTESRTPGFNPVEDSLLAFDENNQLVGYAEFFNLLNPAVRSFANWYIKPGFEGPGLDEMFIDWLNQRARQDIALVPENLKIVNQAFINTREQSKQRALEESGYVMIRHNYRMFREFTAPPEAIHIPEGLVIRPMQPTDKDIHLAAIAEHDSFKDHFGATPDPLENLEVRLRHFLLNDPTSDIQTCFLAMDGEEVAGVVLNSVRLFSDPHMGWVNILGVRRPWRKHGLGLALLLTSFHEFYNRGLTKAGLGVDASSLTGALHLYEHAGMQVSRTYVMYEKEIRPGKDVILRKLD